MNNTFNISLYGKPTRIPLPAVNGTYGSPSAATSDGVIISMKAKDSAGNYTIDCGETTTYAQTIGNTSTQTHGHFSGLGTGYFVIDADYTERYKTIDVEFYTGGSAIAAVDFVKAKGAKDIALMFLIAAPEGIEALTSKHPDVDIFIAAKDDHLNENAYIVPGLGDAGDRIFGTK